MNEPRRMAYLEALGVDSYISRGQLPGAAETQRLVIVKPQAASASPAPQEQLRAADTLGNLREAMREPAAVRANPEQPRRPRAAGPIPSGRPVLDVAVVNSGDWLWLEMLSGMPLMREQVWLIESMAAALLVAGAPEEMGPNPGLPKAVKASVIQFKWPIHNNPQLDSSAEAARASLGGFLDRQQQTCRPRGLVVLGTAAAEWVDFQGLSIPGVATPSTREMLESPALKQAAWRDLRSLVI